MTNPYTEIRTLLGDGKNWAKGVCVIPSENPKKVKFCLMAAVVRVDPINYKALRQKLETIVEIKHPGRFSNLIWYNDKSDWEDISDTLAIAENGYKEVE